MLAAVTVPDRVACCRLARLAAGLTFTLWTVVVDPDGPPIGEKAVALT